MSIDDKRFLMVEPVTQLAVQYNVVLNWFEELDAGCRPHRNESKQPVSQSPPKVHPGSESLDPEKSSSVESNRTVGCIGLIEYSGTDRLSGGKHRPIN